MAEETWKPITGYFVAYEVSSHGRVRSIDRYFIRKDGFGYTLKGKLRKLMVRAKDGYVTVNLILNKERNTQRVHRLVAAAFCNKPDGCDEVNHKDGNKANNQHTNLEWVTRKDNVRHQFDVLGQQGPWQGKKGADNPHSKPVVIGQYWYPGVSEAARQLGMSQSAVTHAIQRGHKVKGMEASYG